MKLNLLRGISNLTAGGVWTNLFWGNFQFVLCDLPRQIKRIAKGARIRAPANKNPAKIKTTQTYKIIYL